MLNLDKSFKICYSINRAIGIKWYWKVFMSILLSLLFYNPIEAYTLILLCDIISGNSTKLNVKNVFMLYIFGSVNFVIQYIPNLTYGNNLFIVVTFGLNYFVIPLSILLFYKIMSTNITYSVCVIAEFVNCIFIIIISGFFNIFIKSYNMFFLYNRFHEFISNFAIFFVQILLYNTIKHRRVYYEKLRKGNRQ